MTVHRAATCTLVLATACARSGDASSSFSGGPSPGTGAAASSGSDSGGPDSSGTSTGTGGGNSGSGETSAPSMPALSTGTFDVGVPPDFDPPVGCHGKIEFLFVIESWYAMKKYQDQLQGAFSTSTNMIGQEFADFAHLIMVVDAGGTPLLPNTCDDCYMCIGCTMPGCGDFGGPLEYPCNEETTECDVTEGAGVTITGNFNASNQRCELFGDNRYIIKGEPALAETLACIASLARAPRHRFPRVPCSPRSSLIWSAAAVTTASCGRSPAGGHPPHGHRRRLPGDPAELVRRAHRGQAWQRGGRRHPGVLARPRRARAEVPGGSVYPLLLSEVLSNSSVT